MVPRFAKRLAKSSLSTLGFSLHDLRKNNDLSVFLPGHLKSLLDRLKINCVIDVGANVGQYGKMLRRIGYKGRIVSIEPVGDLFEKLSLAAANDDEWVTLNIGCGSIEETKTINIFLYSQHNSFLPPSPNMSTIDSRVVSTQSVSVRRLESIFKDVLNGIEDPRVFLKTDVQGLDLDVIKGAGDGISQVEGVQSEIAVIPFYVGVPDYLEFLSYCRSIGFEPTGFFPVFNSPLTGHLIECDVVLIRRHWTDIESAMV
jgi:FkbM family methyltransferase